MPNGPADKSGRIRVGDFLTHVDGVAISGLGGPQRRYLILGCRAHIFRIALGGGGSLQPSLRVWALSIYPNDVAFFP